MEDLLKRVNFEEIDGVLILDGALVTGRGQERFERFEYGSGHREALSPVEPRSPPKNYQSQRKGTTNVLVLMKDNEDKDCLLLAVDSKVLEVPESPGSKRKNRKNSSKYTDEAVKYHHLSKQIVVSRCGYVSQCKRIWRGMDAYVSSHKKHPLYKVSLEGYKVTLDMEDTGCKVLVCGMDKGKLKAFQICSEDDNTRKSHSKFLYPVENTLTCLGSGAPHANYALKDVIWNGQSEDAAKDSIQIGMLNAALGNANTGGNITLVHWVWEEKAFKVWGTWHVMKLFERHFDLVDTKKSLFLIYNEDFFDSDIRSIPNIENHGHALAKSKCGLLVRLIIFKELVHKDKMLKDAKEITFPDSFYHRGDLEEEYSFLKDAKMYLLKPFKVAFLVEPSKKFLQQLQIVELGSNQKFPHQFTFQHEYNKSI